MTSLAVHAASTQTAGAQTAGTKAANRRTLDAICLGRAGVDLYALDTDTPLKQVTAFEKHVGGSAANIAVGMAVLGLRLGIISKVSDDPLGQFVQDYLQSKKINTDGMHTASNGERISLALTEIRNPDCQVVFYRERPADLALAPQEISSAYIQKSQALIITGTALAASPSKEATLQALEIAKAHQTRIFIDLDYRPFGWLSPAQTAVCYRQVALQAEAILGTQEEFQLLFSNTSLQRASEEQQCQWLLKQGTQLVVVKHGVKGCNAYTPNQSPIHCQPFSVKALKPFGAGDAFAASVFSGMLNQQSLPQNLQCAAAAAAMVVSQRTCTEAMPTAQEINNFLAQQSQPA